MFRTDIHQFGSEDGKRLTGGWRRNALLPMAALTLVGIFVCAPYPFAHKAHAFMHGLCAQTPSHSYFLHGHALPFDARMTGIYGGILSTVIILAWQGRHRAAGIPSVGSGIVLVGFVAIMGIDGFNSLLFDLRESHLYQPDNRLRLITGWTTGIAIGVVLAMLIGMTIWRRPKMQTRVVEHWWQPLLLLIPVIPVWFLLERGDHWLYYPFSMLLMASAVMAFTVLVMVTGLLVFNRENRYISFGELQRPATACLILAVVIIASIATARFAVEALTNAPPLV